jgi:hypothetical protein
MNKKTLITSRAFLLTISAMLFISSVFSQNVGIGTPTPNTNAILDISSSNKGLLAPRMDSVSRKSISATKGLIVYDTTTNCYWYNNGGAWVNVPPVGVNSGELLYWNGNRWASLPRGLPGQYLTVSAGTSLPVWSGAGTILLSTTGVTGITQTAAVSGGNISADGGAAITARGVVWSLSPNPTVALTTKTNDGSGTGSFTSNITGLSAGYTYYVRAYATNANGTTYGNQVNFNTSTPASFTIGQVYGGGVIFYIDGTGQHGLIAAASDQSTGITWDLSSGNPLVTNASGLAIGTGAANTTTILNVVGNGSYAASLCRLYYNGGGFTDWYLPSLYELNQLYFQRDVVGGFNSGFVTTYWSSSESNSSSAWGIDFSAPGPNQSSIGKYNSIAVRAIRAF